MQIAIGSFCLKHLFNDSWKLWKLWDQQLHRWVTQTKKNKKWNVTVFMIYGISPVVVIKQITMVVKHVTWLQFVTSLLVLVIRSQLWRLQIEIMWPDFYDRRKCMAPATCLNCNMKHAVLQWLQAWGLVIGRIWSILFNNSNRWDQINVQGCW